MHRIADEPRWYKIFHSEVNHCFDVRMRLATKKIQCADCSHTKSYFKKIHCASSSRTISSAKPKHYTSWSRRGVTRKSGRAGLGRMPCGQDRSPKNNCSVYIQKHRKHIARIPGHALHEKGQQKQKATIHWSAARNEERFLSCR